MKKRLFVSLFLLIGNLVKAQFKNDNVVYKTVYLQDLCHELDQLKGGLLLDVRTPGEFSDTSRFSGLNIGHLKGARNISSREIGKRLAEIKEYKNKPILLYCSHSQRSRIVSKMLIDSGFVNVTNLNGGMTEFNMLKNKSTDCLNQVYETANPFQLLSPTEAFKLIKSTKDLYILDVRADSAYQGITQDALLNAYGKLKNSVNYPSAVLKENMHNMPKEKPILIVDNFGDNACEAAQLLWKNGYRNVNVLFNGLDNWISGEEADLKERKKVWLSSPNYGLISSLDFHQRMLRNRDCIPLDIRTAEEFTNTVKGQTYRNRGHIKNAVHIPQKDLEIRLTELEKYKDREIVVYGFSGGTEAFASAKLLADNGFKKVKVLSSGLSDLRWRAANSKGFKDMMQWVVDVPIENQ